MTRLVQQPLVDRKEFHELYRKLRFWWGMRHIEESAYLLGMHVLQKMSKQDSLEVSGTWREFAGQIVMRGGEILAGPVDDNQYMFLGALHQLQGTVGVLSHINQEGIELTKADAYQNLGRSPHFTKEPGVDPNLIGADTPLLFVYVPWAGYDMEATWAKYPECGRLVNLPNWLTVKGRG